MPFEVRPIDITEIRCDAIVNSLGVNTDTYGAICRSIVSKAKSEDLKAQISSWKKEANPGKIFLSPGYNLPCKHIIHIVTPFFSHDDQLFALEYVYKLALLAAYKRGWKHIALPIIGTGANGYPHAYVLKMITSLVEAFVKNYKNMHVTICMPVISYADYEKKFDKNGLEKSITEFFIKHEKTAMRDFIYNKNDFDRTEYGDIEHHLKYSDREILEIEHLDIYQIKRASIHTADSSNQFLDEKEVLLESGERPVKFKMTELWAYSITAYIEKYIDTRYKSDYDKKLISKHVSEIVGGADNATSLKHKHTNEKKRTTISTAMLMRYILALHMNKYEADDFLLFCGKTFSPVSKEDFVYEQIIKLKKYDITAVNGLCLKYGVDPIFKYGEALEK